MKKIIFLFLLSSKIFGQYPILNDSIKKPGIYTSFQEFKNNNPSIPLNYKIITNPVIISGKWGKEKIDTYSLDISKNESKQIGEVFGFSDGFNFYITYGNQNNFSRDLLNNSKFFKIKKMSKYPYLDILFDNGIRTSNNGGVFFASSTERIEIAVLSLETGELNELTKSLLREILSDKPELLKKFNDQKNKNDYLKKYLDDYLNN